MRHSLTDGTLAVAKRVTEWSTFSRGLATAEDRGRERHYRLDRTGLGLVDGFLAELTSRPPFAESDLDGLDLELRRTVPERRNASETETEDTALSEHYRAEFP